MRTLAIDPGTCESAFVLLNDLQILTSQIVPNDQMLAIIKSQRGQFWDVWRPAEVMVVEMFESMGMAVGKEVFETVWWIGRFCEASPVPFHRVYRKDVKLHLCGQHRAKDANIRQALLDKLGPQGTRKAPGPTFGIKSHLWAALAVGVTWIECGNR